MLAAAVAAEARLGPRRAQSEPPRGGRRQSKTLTLDRGSDPGRCAGGSQEPPNGPCARLATLPPSLTIMSGTSTPTAGNALLLKRQLTELTKRPVDGFSAGLKDDSNLYEWDIMIIGPQDTLYEGGFLHAELIFPPEYPLLPPKMRFLTKMWHPNIYEDGTVCISILHPPGTDQYGYEDAGERWLPVHSVESILISVISLLSSDHPNTDSPANVDAAKQVREDLPGYKKRVRLQLSVAKGCTD